MKVKFINGFRGKETNEVYYEPGQVVDLDDDTAALLIRDGRCTAVEIEIVVEEPPKPKPATRRSRKAKGSVKDA